ncbi:Flagellum site-determining protein YlxH [Aquicella siphonis]|uniref:Iron-sulfur cluster carrier protein n=1 Tax=Aquicella siphonis TaxID=254247 RepID=A0A5E4PGU5_9COXI|nr:iron-sulfur cluster carrier protein ApbC [Aquicella siphonis]VVC76199.1 Flagellum site-determining protein YlxH [Aquicella siphonis]
MLQKEIENRLTSYQDPVLDGAAGTVKAVKRVVIEQDKVAVELVFGYPHASLKQEIISRLTDRIAPLVPGKLIEINLTAQIDAHVGRQGMQGLPQIKNIVAVASGKGGVGKSTVAINLALALSREGARVGMLDADIYGPSQPAMLGTAGERPVVKERAIHPLRRHGIQSISIGNLVDASSAMVWRGPMLGKALEQLMYDTVWENLDYLIVDLPPGTGDVQLTLCQKIPVSGAVIVTTPQDLALLDVRRACEMFNKLGVPILGVAENMSIYHCPQCGHAEQVFGQGGGARLADEYGLALLGMIPLDIRIREMTDSGHPPVVQEPESRYAKAFYAIAHRTAARLSMQAKDYTSRFPRVVVQQAK